MDTGTPGNEHPENLNYEPLPTSDFDLPPEIKKHREQLTDSEWGLARWAYSTYWSNPGVFTYNEFIWTWAFTYYEYGAAFYDLDKPWFTPAGIDPFIVANFGEMAATELIAMAGIVGGALPGRIGSAGANRLGSATDWEIRQFRQPGGKRIYDGRIPNSGIYLEIKTSSRGTYYPNKYTRSQLAFDIDYSDNVLWCFVDCRPSPGLVRMLEAAEIPWMKINTK